MNAKPKRRQRYAVEITRRYDHALVGPDFSDLAEAKRFCREFRLDADRGTADKHRIWDMFAGVLVLEIPAPPRIVDSQERPGYTGPTI